MITPDEPSALRICEDINAFFGPDHQQMAFYYPARELTYRDVEGVSREYEHARLKVLGLLSGGDCPIVVASAEAALLHTMPPQELKARTVAIHPRGGVFPWRSWWLSFSRPAMRGGSRWKGCANSPTGAASWTFTLPRAPTPTEWSFGG